MTIIDPSIDFIKLKEEYIKLKAFHTVFSNYFKYWFCEVCGIQMEHEVGFEPPVCSICGSPTVPWLVQAAKEQTAEAKKYEEKYNNALHEKEKILRQVQGIRNICSQYGFAESDDYMLPQFLEEKLSQYEALLNAFPEKLRINLGKAKENEKLDSDHSSHSRSGDTS
jgi:hypothetical protein